MTSMYGFAYTNKWGNQSISASSYLVLRHGRCLLTPSHVKQAPYDRYAVKLGDDCLQKQTQKAYESSTFPTRDSVTLSRVHPWASAVYTPSTDHRRQGCLYGSTSCCISHGPRQWATAPRPLDRFS